MFGGSVTLYVVYVLLVQLTPRCSAPQPVTPPKRPNVPMEKTYTTEDTLSEDRIVVEANADYISSTSSFPITQKPPINTNEQTQTSSLDNDTDNSQSPPEGTNTHAYNQDNKDSSQVSNTTIMKLLPSMLQHFCKGGHICLNDQNISETKISEGQESCCSDCSCLPDCALTGQCCFPEQLHETNTECISESFPRSIKLNSYKMVTSELNNDDNTSLIEPCGEKVVAPWGSIFPVFSKSHRKIYKNKHCADAYNVTDGVTWNIFVNCPTSISLLDNKLLYYCLVYFQYPGNFKDIVDWVCFTSKISNNSWCQNEGVPEPRDMPFKRDQILSACYSGLVSPFTLHGKMFANVFCAMCNNPATLTPGTCSAANDIFERRGDGLMFLLDTSLLPELNSPPDILLSSQNLACIADRCRPLLCSSEKFLTSTGECKFVAKEWYNYDYMVPLLLTSDHFMNMTEVFSISSGGSSIRPLQSPWSKRWTISRVLYEVSATGDRHMANTIIVIMWQSLKKVSPNDILQNIKRFKNRSWVIEIQNAKYVLKADFVGNRNFNPLSGGRILKMQDGNINASTITLPKLIKIFETSIFLSMPVLINEMFYCDQVELLPSEFELKSNFLYNRITGRFIFQGLFTDLSSESYLPVKICLEYSGMISSNNTADNSCIMPFLSYILPFCIIAEWLV